MPKRRGETGAFTQDMVMTTKYPTTKPPSTTLPNLRSSGDLRKPRDGDGVFDSTVTSMCRLTIRLSGAGLRQRRTKALYPDHRLPPWPTEDATRDRSNRLLAVTCDHASSLAACACEQPRRRPLRHRNFDTRG